MPRNISSIHTSSTNASRTPESLKKVKDLINSKHKKSPNERTDKVSSSEKNDVEKHLKEKLNCDDEKDICEAPDTDSSHDIKSKSIVHARIASYELCDKKKFETLPRSQSRPWYGSEKSSEDVKLSKNIISGNKNVLNCLSTEQLYNLNIKVDRGTDKKVNRLRDGSFRASRTGVRTSFMSSRNRKRGLTRQTALDITSDEEKGSSDCKAKENERDSNRDTEKNDLTRSLVSSNEFRINYGEYAIVNKRKKEDSYSRSTSTSPDKEYTTKKLILNATKGNITKSSKTPGTSRYEEPNSKTKNELVKTQVVKLKKRNSRNVNKSDYRVSVTIRPSIVADLTNKFNTISLQSNQTRTQSPQRYNKNNAFLRYHCSPKASFKRKYRQKAAKIQKEQIKFDKTSLSETVISDCEGHYSTRRSLSNSLAELNMKDLFEESDYNKTDEEKVCERLKTALCSEHFKGEDDSEDEEVLDSHKEAISDGYEANSPSHNISKVSGDTHNKILEADNSNNAETSSLLNVCDESNSSSVLKEELNKESKVDINKSNDSGIHSISGSAQSPINIESKDENLLPDSIDNEISEVDVNVPEVSADTSKDGKIDAKIYANIVTAVKNSVKKNKEKNSKENVRKTKSSTKGLWFIGKRFKKSDIINSHETEQIAKDAEFEKEQVENSSNSEIVDSDKNTKDSKLKTTPEEDSELPHTDETKEFDKDTVDESKKKPKREAFYGLFSFGSKEKQRKSEKRNKKEKEQEFAKQVDECNYFSLETNSQKDIVDKIICSETEEVKTTPITEEKVIPPPPTTPIPSPPCVLKKVYEISSSNEEQQKGEQNLQTNEEIQNEDIVNLNFDKEMKKAGFHPNSSFLWSSAVNSVDAYSIEPLYGYLNPLGFQHAAVNILPSNNDSVPNYSEISEVQSDTQAIYEGTNSVISYDEIKPPSSSSYDEISHISITRDISHLPEYDPIIPIEDENGPVQAKIAIVKEHQIESLCYEYDDEAHYNASLSSHSYEPVCPQDDVFGPSTSSICLQRKTDDAKFDYYVPNDYDNDQESDDDVHEVFSYEITNIGNVIHVKSSGKNSSHSGANNSKKKNIPKKKQTSKVKAKNEWIDISDIPELPTLSIRVPVTRLQKKPRAKSRAIMSWTHGVRRYRRAHPNPSSNAANRADVEKDDEEPVDHYEAIYEVINANEHLSEPEEEEYDDDIDFNDSFDSDDSSEYCRLRPISTEEVYEESRYRTDSFSSGLSKSMKNLKYIRQSSQPHSINKIAEAANSGMKKLKRNWSYTKHEVRTGFNKIKKKSTFSTHDMKSQENIYEETTPNSASSEKGKWSFKSHFRRKLSSSSSTTDIPKELKPFSSQKAKERPTFYLTLTIASDSQEELSSSLAEDHQRKISAPSLPCLSLAPSDGAVPKSKSTSNVPMRTVSARSLHGGLSRPKTAPPAPPASDKNKEKEEEEDEPEETSKDQLMLKLNQILSAGQVLPPGRRVLRSSDSPSLDYPSISSSEEDRPKSLVNYASIHPPSRHSSCSIEPPRLNIPKNRLSVSSSDDSEGYIRPSEIATLPPPLPARPLSGSNFIRRPLKIPSPETKSYLEFNYDDKVQNKISNSRFQDEPLYQFYTAKIERAALCQADCSSEDDYEVINDGTCKQEIKYSRPTAMELVTPSDGRRTLWCELPEVISSGILNKISGQERKIQEAIFEVITSEASYLKSLDILVTHFMNCPEFTTDDETAIISRREAKVLFSDILPVKKFSEQFLDDLERRWQESVQISGITDIVLKHADSFNVFVKYCSNQIYQDRMLRYLKCNPRFVDVVNRLESSPVCQLLAMHSFLMLPMQRITRLPLLLDAIFNRLEYASSQWQECKAALTTITKIVAECNEGARKMERMEEMLILSGQLDFREVRATPLISASRWLVKKGELTRLTWRESDTKLTFGRKISKHTLYFFLFSDLLIVTKKKNDDQYLVLDYCPRNMVQVLELENANRFPGRILEGYKNLLIMTMLQNHENRTVEMVLSCTLESDRTRWIEAVTPRTSENPDERVYEEWDCPQVQATHSYSAIQPDELSLKIADVINVLKKTSDGWFQGERIRDGEKGWFPGNHTTEIASAHVRARNLRQRYRLLVISGSFIKKEREEREDKKKERRKTVTTMDSL